MTTEKQIAALFDFDGVVVDTEPQYSIFWNEQGRLYHPEVEEFGRKIKGQTLTQIFDGNFAGMEEVQSKITSDLNEYEENMTFEFIPGVLDFMKALRAEGIKIAIVTSSNDKKMAHVYRQHPTFTQLVDKILTADMFKESKPNPECFLLGAKVFDTTPENCVVFEDSFHGLEAARRAKMTIIGLCTTNSRESINDKAHVVIDDFRGFTVEKMKQLMNN